MFIASSIEHPLRPANQGYSAVTFNPGKIFSPARYGKSKTVVHPRSPQTIVSRCLKLSSSQANLRHTKHVTRRCYLPVLTGLATLRRIGPGYQRIIPVFRHNNLRLSREFDPARADCRSSRPKAGIRAPLAPRLAQPEKSLYVNNRF